MHGRFTGSQILIQNGNLAVKNSVVLFIPNPLQPKDAFLCLWTQVERSTVWICMNALLFMLLPNMVRSYWSALYWLMEPTSSGLFVFLISNTCHNLHDCPRSILRVVYLFFLMRWSDCFNLAADQANIWDKIHISLGYLFWFLVLKNNTIIVDCVNMDISLRKVCDINELIYRLLGYLKTGHSWNASITFGGTLWISRLLSEVTVLW